MDHFRLCEGDNGVIIMPPTDTRALVDLAFDLYEQPQTRQEFMAAFRHQIMTDPTTHDLFLAVCVRSAYSWDRPGVLRASQGDSP
jgi:hypothetical protein